MSTEHVEALVAARRSFLIAPAGCGKTEVIAKAVSKEKSRQLILTHTHAGVCAILERLKRLEVPANKYRVDTIAGWALEYVMAFPVLGGLLVTMPDDEQWEEVYSSVTSILKRTSIRAMLRDSYSGIFVDEYQDCTKWPISPELTPGFSAS